MRHDFTGIGRRLLANYLTNRLRFYAKTCATMQNAIFRHSERTRPETLYLSHSQSETGGEGGI